MGLVLMWSIFAVASMGRDHEESQKDMHATDHVNNKHGLKTQMLHVGYTFAYISHWMWLVFT